MHPDWTWSNVTPNHTSTRQLPNRCKRIDSCSTTSHSPIRRDSSSLLSSSRCRTLQLPAFVPSSLSGRPRLFFKLLSPSIWGFGDLILAFNGPAQLLVFTYTTLLWRFTHSFTHLNLTYTKPRTCLLRIPAQAFSHHSLGLQILRQKPICL